MAAIGANAALLSNDVLAKWLIEDFPFRIQLAPVFPFHPIGGDRLRYATTPVLNLADSIDFAAPIADDTKYPNDPNRLFSFAELATHFRITYKAQDIFSSNVNDQTAVQMALAIRELLYRYWRMFESGDATNPGEFNGLLQLVDPWKTIDLNCQPLTLEILEQGKELVRTNDGRCVVIYTSSAGKRAIHAAHWVRGLPSCYQEMSFPNPAGGTQTQEVLIFDGAPVYVCDLNQVARFEFSPNGDPNLIILAPEETLTVRDSKLATNIWFFVMGENNLHGITPAPLGSSIFVTRSTILPDGSTIVYHVTMPAGIALGSVCALAVIKNAAIPREA